jgi:hypothetical protein
LWQYTVTMLSEHEQERFLRLWAGAQPAVTAFVHAVVRDSAAAKDLVQETALGLFRRFADYDGYNDVRIGRVTGWDGWVRDSGKIQLSGTTPAFTPQLTAVAPGKGQGLLLEADRDRPAPDGRPSFQRLTDLHRCPRRIERPHPSTPPDYDKVHLRLQKTSVAAASYYETPFSPRIAHTGRRSAGVGGLAHLCGQPGHPLTAPGANRLLRG